MHPWLRLLTSPPLMSLLPTDAGASAAPRPALDQPDALLRAAGLAHLTAPGRPPMSLLLPESADEALAGASLTDLQVWLLRHLAAGDAEPAGVLETLDGSLLHQQRGAVWRDASGQAVRLQPQAQRVGGWRVHRLDRALVPARDSLAAQLQADSDTGLFVQALRRTGLLALLDACGPFTVFAPSDAALARAPARLGLSRSALWSDTQTLTELLAAHVAPGRWPSARLPWGGTLRTWAPQPLLLSPLGQIASGDLALPLAAGSDRAASNGVLHRVSEVLLPPAC
ncbi:MAG: fasciclin domain-containing protein [Roseateles sp.]|nr:MAG: fasciclin domain-containing protein [Roseateles sp.]